MQTKILAVKDNDRYKLRCLFYGKELNLPQQEKVDAIELVVLQDLVSGKEVKYSTQEESSNISSLGYFTEVWSPGGEYDRACKCSRFGEENARIDDEIRQGKSAVAENENLQLARCSPKVISEQKKKFLTDY